MALAEDPVELLGLVLGAREAVEDEAVLDLGRVREPLLDHLDDDVVGDELAAVHVLLGLRARPGRPTAAESRKSWPVERCWVLKCRGQPLTLGALAGTLLAQDHQARSALSQQHHPQEPQERNPS